jgi:hypothetical protein
MQGFSPWLRYVGPSGRISSAAVQRKIRRAEAAKESHENSIEFHSSERYAVAFDCLVFLLDRFQCFPPGSESAFVNTRSRDE